MARRKYQTTSGDKSPKRGLLRRLVGSKPASKPSGAKPAARKSAQPKPTIRRKSLDEPPTPNVDLPPLEKQSRVPQVSKQRLSTDRKLDILGVALVLSSTIVALGAVSEAGALTGAILKLLGQVFGWFAPLYLFLTHLLGWWLILRNFRERPARIEILQIIGFVLLSVTLLGGVHFLGMLTSSPEITAFYAAETGQGGGYIGAYTYQILVDAISVPGTAIVLSGALIVSLMFTFDVSFGELADFIRGWAAWSRGAMARWRARTTPTPASKPVESVALVVAPPAGAAGDEAAESQVPPETLPARPGVQQPLPDMPEPARRSAPPVPEGPAESLYGPPLTICARQNWALPEHREILVEGDDREDNDQTLVEQARLIEDTLASFGAPGRVVEINPGPVITQFGVEPDYLEGRGGKKVKVKVSKIAALADDIALALAARSVRVEAPVPGKGFVGVEVPNPQPLVVNLREVVESEPFQDHKGALKVGLGQNVDGEAVVVDLTSMPHLLIAGATGAGKSICINAIIACLLLQHSPVDLRFIMIDPKRVELTSYNDIPHLLTPVVTDVNRTVGTLKWVTREMDDRYRRFAQAGARNIADYNKKLKKGERKLPYLIVVVDELADLMMMAPQETESVITRIAQMARATGIHLILSTQRPSVDVVTGLIKANFPARIAFAVASMTDSRVILDMPGAEKLLGRGDMLYQAPDSSAIVRLQGVFVSDEELDRLVRFWLDQAAESPDDEAAPPLRMLAGFDPGAKDTLDRPPPRPPKTTPIAGATPPPVVIRRAVDHIIEKDSAPPEDDLYPEAEKLVRQMEKASTSLLQRHLRIGYNRASRLMDALEANGVVAPSDNPSQPREVLPMEMDDSF
ncbi:MAG: DNA translocase FtsK 4TM domain-containing protein [Anaerolineae bacterium]|nr:DNA translocase FtsK 4TM domain-containing protein [Anaerolineae bacterium]